MELVYLFETGSNGEDCVVFAPRERAERIGAIYTALEAAATWGDFKDMLPEGEWERYIGVCLDPMPGLDDEFDADQVPGYAEGDYPPWLAQEQLDWFPDELIEKYDGEIGDTALNGMSLNLPECNAELIADELRSLGHTVKPFRGG